MGYAWPELLSQNVPRYVDAVSTQHGWSSTVAGLGSSGKIAEKCSYFFSHPAIEWGLETSILSWKFQFLRGADSDVYINKQHKVIWNKSGFSSPLHTSSHHDMKHLFILLSAH